MKIQYDYSDVPTVKEFALSNKFVRGLMGPFGSGKSSGCVIEIIRRAAEQEPQQDGIRRTRWAVIRNTYPQLKDTTIKTFHQWLPPKQFGQWKSQEHDYLITGIEGCHIEVMFRALDRPDQVANLLSLELTGAWLNEAREIPKPIFDAVQGRVGRFPAIKDGGCTWSGVFLDTNPPDVDSWWYRVFEESVLDDGGPCVNCGKPSVRVFNQGTPEETRFCKEHDNFAAFKQPSGLSKKAENKKHLRKNYYQDLSQGKDPEYVKVYVHGEYGFVIDGRPVYSEYKDQVHCKEVSAIKHTVIHRGWDFGLTPACVLSQLTPRGQWVLIDEIVSDDMGIDRFSDAVLEHCATHYKGFTFEDEGDPAGSQRAQTDEKTCFQILASKGVYITPGEQDLIIRLESVKKPLSTMINGEPGLIVSPRCKNLRKGFQGGYQMRRLQTSGERYTEKPDKNKYSHIHDALQYTATRLFGDSLRIQKETETTNKRHTRRAHYSNWKTA